MKKIFLNAPANGNSLQRRHFIATAFTAAGAALLPSTPFAGVSTNFGWPAIEYTVQDIINIILKEIPGAPFSDTVDTIKSGSASQQVTGIVTTMFATIHVIRDAAKLKANFIIAHEPTFYNHKDDTNWVANNEIVKEKQALLQQHNMVVWRFHDYWHSVRPDGIKYGVLKMAGWQQYSRPGETVLKMPPAPLKKIIDHLKSSLGITHVKVIGDLEQLCGRIAIMPGASGGQAHVAVAEKEKPDLLIVGEVQEWETAEYIRDARLLGSKISLVILGHSLSEEPGMEWLVEWLQPRLPGIKIKHIASKDPFTWV